MAVASVIAAPGTRQTESLNHYAVRSPVALINLMHQTRKRIINGGIDLEDDEDEDDPANADDEPPRPKLPRSLGEMMAAAKSMARGAAAGAGGALSSSTSAAASSAPVAAAPAVVVVSPLPEFEINAPSSWGEWRPFHQTRLPESARRISIGDMERFSAEQRHAAHLIEAGVSVFVTGPGGTGKSELIHAIKRAGEESDVNVVVTASTGIAARNIGGITLHRFAGLGLIDESKMRGGECLNRVRRMDDEDYRITNWQEVDVLIVDEISMLSMFMLRELDAVARHARMRNGKGISIQPFGGIQLVFLGDFAQLIPESGGGAAGAGAGAGAGPLVMPLQGTWCEFVPYTVLLQTIFRQKDDAFRGMLNRIRLGAITKGDLYRLNASVGGETLASGETGPELCAFRKMVQQANDKAMSSLPGGDTPKVYSARAINWSDNERARKEFDAVVAEIGAELPVSLCVGARVLLTKNIDPDRGLVNGALGKVVGFEESSPVTTSTSTPQHLPLVLWDHMTTPMTVQPIVVDSSGRMVVGSSSSSGSGGSGTGSGGGGVNDDDDTTAAGPESGSAISSKKQLVSFMPLLCAWSMTVHRAQGMTLDRVRVNARSMRTPALLYTALSRVRSMGGLQIAGGKVSAENVVAHPQVVAYYHTLEESVSSELPVMPSTIVAANARRVLGIKG